MDFENLIFPDGFLWGSAASAHQTEGWNHNSWSEWEKIPGKIVDGSNADVACDHYNRYEEDFDLARNLGHQVHRFSIEWSRIEPKQGKWNMGEIDHYRSVVKVLLDRNIRPMMTLHHFANPLWFRDADAWLNPESPEMFGDYARKVTECFSDFDIVWNTINEPMVVVAMGYLYGEFPPGIQDFGKAQTVTRHLLMAHGQAATQVREVYEELGKEQPQIAPVISTSHFMPADLDNKDDIELVNYLDELYNQAWIRGAVTGILPDLEGGGTRYSPLDNSVDFIGVNYYSRMLVSSELDFLAGEMSPKDPNLERCEGLDWEVFPEGYYHVLKSYWDKYKKPIFLTENGIGTLDDSLRRRYLLTHIQQAHRAIQDGVDIRGYLVWSLTDNFEWAQGFSSHFGLIEVNYDTQERTPRESAYLFRDIINYRGLPREIQEKYLG
ncbi:MAG: glycoside hydrolase family 1 protein [Candidatus Thorarchaeota archaeon]